jgi:hypothetical protein
MGDLPRLRIMNAQRLSSAVSTSSGLLFPDSLPDNSEASASVKPDATKIAGTIFEAPSAGPKGETQGRVE